MTVNVRYGQSVHSWTLQPRRPSFTGFTPRGLPIISEVTQSAGMKAMISEWNRHNPSHPLKVRQHTSTE